jgi:periplasmic nitrate reductase subunit NapC
MKQRLLRIWRWWRRPSRLALGTLLILGFAGGIIFWGGFNTAMEMTNREQFCIGCHEMRNNVYQEYMQTVHYNNRSGVRAPARIAMCRTNGAQKCCANCKPAKRCTPRSSA